MRTRILVLAVAAALSGCSSVPPTDLPSEVAPEAAVTAIPTLAPSGVASLKADLSIERWWTVFDDAALDRLMEEALRRNEDLEAAVARIREAQAGLDLASAARSPALDLQVRHGRSQQSEVGATPLPRGVERRANTHRVTLEAGYELDLWGKLSSSSAAAQKRLLATEWARATLEWSLTARLAEAYFGLAAVDRQIEISEAVRDSRAATVRLRQREVSAGAGSEFELRRAEAELTATEATLAGLARSRAALERSVTALLGRTPAEINSGRIARQRMDERHAFQPVLPQGSAAQLLVRRPDIRQAEAELAAANHNIAAARAGALPSVRLTGNIGSDAASLSNLFSGPSAVWSLFATLTQAIADGGKAAARTDEETARAGQSLAGYRKTVAGAVLDMREAYETLDITRQAFDAERSRAASLARAHELARLGHQHGALNTLDLLDAERNWHQAQLQQVTAYRDQLVAQVSAFKALGGGHAGVH